MDTARDTGSHPKTEHSEDTKTHADNEREPSTMQLVDNRSITIADGPLDVADAVQGHTATRV